MEQRRKKNGEGDGRLTLEAVQPLDGGSLGRIGIMRKTFEMH